MIHLKIYLLLSVIGVSINAYVFDGFPELSHEFRHPFFDDHADLHASGSDPVPNYDYTSEAERFMENPLDYVQTSASKRVLREDKFYKKVTPTFSSHDNTKDRIKYQGSLEKLNGPICQKIKSKATSENGKPRIESLTCYECKEPESGEIFKHCSSSPESRIDEYPAAVFRDRRSSSRDNVALASDFPDYLKSRDPYIFGEEYFGDASHDAPTKYAGDAKDCERVVKDTMVCMVCTDKKTNGKYEQCSYVAQPNEKSYAYSQKSSFGKPKANERNDKKEEGTENKDFRVNSKEPDVYYSQYSKPEEYHAKSSEQSEDYYPRSSKSDHHYPGSSKQSDDYYSSAESQPKEQVSSDSSNKNEDSASCKEVQRDSKTCTVCTDPKTGGNYEKCSYSYQPNDKVYKFSRSKSFGNPKSKENSKNDSNSKGNSKIEVPDYSQKSAQESKQNPREYLPNYGYVPNYDKDYSVPGSPGYREPERSESNRDEKDRYGYPSYFDKSDGSKKDDPYLKSESERVTEKIDEKNCKEVKKDTMTCTVCQDPKTGGNLERCSYSYQPNDKVYSYSKARSYGKPKKTENPAPGSSENKEKSQPYRTSYQYSYPNYNKEKKSENPAPGSSENQEKSEPYQASYRYSYPNYSDVKKSENPSAGSSENQEKSQPLETSYDYTYPVQSYSYSYGEKPASSRSDNPSSESSENPEKTDSYSRTYEYKPRKFTYSSESKPSFTVGDSNRRQFDSSPKFSENSSKEDKEEASSDPKNVTVDFVDKQKKAELEQFMKEFEKEDRSKCKKVMRDKMTCYQCLDDKGVQKEECIFVAEEKPAKDRLEYREVKQFQLDPQQETGKSSTSASEASFQRKPRRRVEEPVLEPIAAATKNSGEKTSREDRSKEVEDAVKKENLKEIGPYEYVLETRPVYDEVLGLTLPAYMLEKSEHEAEFDEIVSGRS